MEMCKDYVKFLEVDAFINENYGKLTREEFEYLVNVLEELKDRIIGE